MRAHSKPNMKSTYTKHDTSHGSPYDRGAADSHYSRPFDPHCVVGTGSYNHPRTNEADMSLEQITAYTDGYFDNERQADKKVVSKLIR